MSIKLIHSMVHQVRSAMKVIAAYSPISVQPKLGTVFLYTYTSTSIGEIEERPVTQIVDFCEPLGRIYFLDGFPSYVSHRGAINSFGDGKGNFVSAVFASVSKSQIETHREGRIKKNSLTNIEGDNKVAP